MRSKIVQKLISVLLSFVLMASIFACIVRFVPTSEPSKPKKQIVEACLICGWIAWYQWVKAGGTWSGGETRPLRPSGSKPGEDEKL